jgi:hypothetical protein
MIVFLENYTGRKLPSKSCFRKRILDEVYEEGMCSLKRKLSNVKSFLIFDESTDFLGINIFNVLIGDANQMKGRSLYVKI